MGEARIQDDAVENFLTESDWQHLKNPGESVDFKENVVASRLSALGVTCPGVPLLKRAAAIVRYLHFGESSLEGRVKANIAYELKRMIKDMDSDTPRLPHLITFKHHPDYLEPQRWELAYTKEDPPVDASKHIDVAILARLSCDMVYKGTHTELRGVRPVASPLSQQPNCAAGGAWQSYGANPMMDAMSQMQALSTSLSQLHSVVRGLQSSSQVHPVHHYDAFRSRRSSTFVAESPTSSCDPATKAEEVDDKCKGDSAHNAKSVVDEMLTKIMSTRAACKAKAKTKAAPAKAKAEAKPKAKDKAKPKAKAEAKPKATPANVDDMKEKYKHVQGILKLVIQKNDGHPFFKIFEKQKQILQARIPDNASEIDSLFDVMKKLMDMYHRKKVKKLDLRDKRDEMLMSSKGKKRSAAAAL